MKLSKNKGLRKKSGDSVRSAQSKLGQQMARRGIIGGRMYHRHPYLISATRPLPVRRRAPRPRPDDVLRTIRNPIVRRNVPFPSADARLSRVSDPRKPNVISDRRPPHLLRDARNDAPDTRSMLRFSLSLNLRAPHPFPTQIRWILAPNV